MTTYLRCKESLKSVNGAKRERRMNGLLSAITGIIRVVAMVDVMMIMGERITSVMNMTANAERIVVTLGARTIGTTGTETGTETETETIGTGIAVAGITIATESATSVTVLAAHQGTAHHHHLLLYP